MRDYIRGSGGKFVSGDWCDGYEHTPEHKAKVRLKALERAKTGYRHISVLGKVYANLTEASAKVGVSTRTLKRYAESDKHQHFFFVN